MEDEFDFEKMFDFATNLNGQWQPSSMPNVFDASLNSQILVDVDLSTDDISTQINLNNDDISNALIDTPITPFSIDDISKFITTPIGELPQQSTIEDNLERINLNQIQTDNLSSSICIQMGSSPIEQKEIDNSILARQYVKEQQRIYKNASKSRRTSGYQQPSSTVGPIDVVTSHGACQPCTTVQIQSDYDYTDELLQFDAIEPKKIIILSQPRPNFRPRTENESKTASHYIRCEANSQYEYPTISIPFTWLRGSVKNIIEVTLLAKDGEPHDYKIDNKTSKTSFDDDALIFRQNQPHTLYFCVTDDDFKNGYKSFMIEYIKPKQEGNITKELIKTRQLEQSILRFTRIYQTEKDTYQRDDNSVEYSCLMNEAYSDVAVEHMGPKYGPMGGNERVYTLLKGRISKDDLTVIITEEITGWYQQLPITKNGNIIYFSMPAFPHSQFDRIVANITIYYKGVELFQSPYLYKGSLDQELAELNLNDSSVNMTGTSTSTTDPFNAFEFFQATGVRPVINSSRKSSTTKRTKRLNK